eukprot:scaffold115443_cov22-Prasinocladus_malaysianus.AAC.1
MSGIQRQRWSHRNQGGQVPPLQCVHNLDKQSRSRLSMPKRTYTSMYRGTEQGHNWYVVYTLQSGVYCGRQVLSQQ